MVIDIIQEINDCTSDNVQFYRIEANGLIYGCDYYEDSWNSFDVLYYLWTTEPVERVEGGGGEMYCRKIALIYLLLTDSTLEDIASYNKSLIDEFVKKNFCKWIIGMPVFDTSLKKWRKITGCELHDFKSYYTIEGNKITIDVTYVDGFTSYSGSDDILMWKPKDKDMVRKKVVKDVFNFHGKQIPVEVELIGGEGTTL